MSYLLDKVLGIIKTLKNDELKLQSILDYIETEVVDEEYNYNPIDNLPEKFRPLVNEIAQFMDMGLLCYLNPQTAEISTVPLEMFYDVETSKNTEEMKLKLDEQHGWTSVEFLDWDEPIEFRPFSSNQSYRIMEKFTESLSSTHKLHSTLVEALRNRKPFANFNRIIDNSDLREKWFEFKQQYLDRIVAEKLLMELDDLKEDGYEMQCKNILQ